MCRRFSTVRGEAAGRRNSCSSSSKTVPRGPACLWVCGRFESKSDVVIHGAPNRPFNQRSPFEDPAAMTGETNLLFNFQRLYMYSFFLLDNQKLLYFIYFMAPGYVFLKPAEISVCIILNVCAGCVTFVRYFYVIYTENVLTSKME